MRSQNFDHCHSFLLAFSATGGARKRPPFHKGAFCHATPAALPPAKPPSGEPDRRRFNRSRQLTGDPRPAAAAALPPPKPLRGQADSRHSQQKQAADRGPPSLRRSGPLAAEAALRPGGSQALPTEAGSRPGTLVPRPPGKGPGRGFPFLVSGASRKELESFFPATCAAGKILLTERSVDQRPPLGGLWSAPERSALPSSQHPKGAETGPPRWRKSPWRF